MFSEVLKAVGSMSNIDHHPSIEKFTYILDASPQCNTIALSQGRKQMSNIMFEHRDYIHRIQTDAFVSSKPIHFNTDVKLDELKYYILIF